MKHYAKRDIRGMMSQYMDHVSAMTGEDLRSKSDIAAELAYRDKAINELCAALEEALIWDGTDDCGVDAVWREEACAALDKYREVEEDQ